MRRAARVGVLIFVAAMAVVSSARFAAAQDEEFGKNKVQYKQFHWNILKTPHFDIYFTDGYRDLAARTGVILEHGYVKLAGDFQHQVLWRVPVIVYGSHADFEQTNVISDLIPEAVQAFTEPLRKRMVLHYGGLDNDYAHTAIHELVHIFTFDMIYGSLLRSVFSRNFLFPISLWFTEGLAEYYSSGFDGTAEMFMRDAAVFDYLPELDESGGYMAYKAGQAAIFYLAETYGSGKIIEIMEHIRNQRGSMSMALNSSLGITSAELSRDWRKAMRRRYWPLYADKKEAEFYGRRLTDHMKQHHFLNSKPIFSPDGERILYYSDRKGLDGIYIMNALSGKVEKKLMIGSMSTRFESIRSMNSNLAWSPDGTRIAFVAKSKGRDKLFIMEVPKGRLLREIELPLDFFMSPAWSPKDEQVAMVGTTAGMTDLYVYDLATGELRRLTNDDADEESPTWFPDGRRLAYVRYPAPAVQPVFRPDSTGVERLTGVDFASDANVRFGNGDIWECDIEGGEPRLIIGTPGNDGEPVIFGDGAEILFVSDESGVRNLYRGSVAVGSYSRFTDVLGGIYSASVSTAKDRLVFSAFDAAGFDLFIMESFSEKSKVSYSTGSPYLAEVEAGGARPDTLGAAAAPAQPDTASARADTLEAPAAMSVAHAGEEGAVHGGFAIENVRKGGVPSGSELPGQTDFGREGKPAIVIDEDSQEDVNPDTLEARRLRVTKEVGTVVPYRMKFSPDYIGQGSGVGVYYASGFGLQLLNQIALSDLLGDNHILISFNIFRSIEDSDLLVSYYYLRKRIDYAVGAFQFKNYLNSRVSSIGEVFLDYRYFSERNYGAYALASYPFSTVTRLDAEFEGYVSEREFYELSGDDEYGYFYRTRKSERHLFQPTLSLIHDSAYFGSFGPVIGSRWMASASRTISFSGTDVSRTTVFIDYRKYLPLYYRNYFAFRAIGASSTGNDPRYFFLGGPLTMRGYDYLQFTGSKLVLLNAEYRYPLVDALVFGWPGRWGFRDIGGTLFFDSGALWGEGRYIEPLRDDIRPRVLNWTAGGHEQPIEFYSNFGVGFYVRFGYFILNFQLGWPTDFTTTGRSVFHFYIGPQF